MAAKHDYSMEDTELIEEFSKHTKVNGRPVTLMVENAFKQYRSSIA